MQVVKKGQSTSFFTVESHKCAGDYINVSNITSFCLCITNKMLWNIINTLT